MIIKKLDFQKTCDACPEQYDVFYNGKQVAYVRLRHGFLYAEFPDVGGKEIYEAYPKGDGMFQSERERRFHLNAIADAILKEIEYNTILNECERFDAKELEQIRYALEYLHDTDLSDYGVENVRALESAMNKLHMEYVSQLDDMENF